jgi:hypothetical protein
MLPSESLRQQQAEAIQIAKEQQESAKKRAEKKASAPTKTEPEARAPDLTGGVDVRELRFPANVMMANSSSSLGIGNRYSNSMSISGVIERIVLMPAGYCYAKVAADGTRWVVVMPTGMTAELEP